MTNDKADPPFHFEIWSGPSVTFGDEPKAIYYVENHNAQCGYGELALAFEMSATEIMRKFREDSLGNWIAPIAHLTRQTLELLLKDLLQGIIQNDEVVSSQPLRGHNIKFLWQSSLAWLETHYPAIRNDARLAKTEHLLAAFYAIDPTGDLFRFGQSYQTAFGKRRSYDRVGINLDTLESEFQAAVGLLRHWSSVVWRTAWFADEGEEDTLFDADDFPRC